MIVEPGGDRYDGDPYPLRVRSAGRWYLVASGTYDDPGDARLSVAVLDDGGDKVMRWLDPEPSLPLLAAMMREPHWPVWEAPFSLDEEIVIQS